MAARAGLVCADDAFCLAMLASLSRMMLGTAALAGGAGGLLPAPSEAKKLAGGLPGGVVDASVERGEGVMVRQPFQGPGLGHREGGPTRGSRSIQLVLEGVDHGRREGLALLPDIDQLPDLLLRAAILVSVHPW